MSPVLAPPPVESARARQERILNGDIRPDDYLLITDRVRFLTERELAYGRERLGGLDMTAEAERRQWHQNLLLVHHPDEHVGYLEDENGIIVVVTGLDEIERFLETVPPEKWDGRFATAYPTNDAFALANS